MLKSRSAQVGLFDAAMVMGPLPEGSFFALLAEHGDRIVRDEDFADRYSERMGRPSIPPSQLAKVLLLQHRTGVSDEQAMECVGWDLRWKVALGLAIDHQGWHPTSLTKFRARLLLHKKDGIALENTLRLARELGLLDGPVEQIVDSTPMLGAAATQDTVRLVRFGVRKLIDAVTAADAEAGDALASGLGFDYAPPERQAGVSVAGEGGAGEDADPGRAGRAAGAWRSSRRAGCWMTSRSRRRMSCWVS